MQEWKGIRESSSEINWTKAKDEQAIQTRKAPGGQKVN
jgi:hypothetical protein